MNIKSKYIDGILEIVKERLLKLGLIPEILNHELFYTFPGSGYYRVSFASELNSFVIESAETKEEAEKNVLEDSDLFPLFLGKEKIVKEMEEWFIKYCINIQK